MNSHGGARKGAGRPKTEIDERRLLVLREQGLSIDKIAERFDVTYMTIRYALQKLRKAK
jgi:transposase